MPQQTWTPAKNESNQSIPSPLGAAPSITTTLPGPKAKELIARDERHSSPSYTRDYPLVVKRALGSVVEDVDGNRWIDLAAGIAVCATGHCHPVVVEAIEKQARALIHICGSDFYYPPMIELMEKLAAIVPGKGEKKALLTNSGAEAAEAAFKLARHHTNRKYAIAFHGGFHGRTMGALALTSSKTRQREKFAPLVPMVAHVPFGDVKAIEQTLFKYQMSPSEVACIFVEAIQGEGGYVIARPEFMRDLRALCDKHGILLICDEIQSGMGRTGKWWAYEHFGIEADITLVSKGIASGMPIGAVVARDRIMDWPEGAQGSTFGGNPVCCAAAVATIGLVESQYMSNAAAMGRILLSRLKEIVSASSGVLSDARGIGLMCAVTVTSAEKRERILQAAFAKGLILLGCGELAIRFCPPLCIGQAELAAGLDLFAQSVPAAH
jgi:4-aminobutyrate aminotransferase